MKILMKTVTTVILAVNLVGCAGMQYALPRAATAQAWQADLARGHYTLPDRPTQTITEYRHSVPTGRTFTVK